MTSEVFHKSYRNSTAREKKIKSFLIWFYAIGLAGIIIPFTSGFFLLLTPLALLLSFILLLRFHNMENLLKTFYVFLLIYLLGFGIEVIGVRTGKIFGSYTYGSTLGPKLFDTPLIIGINWLILVYTTSAICEKLFKNRLGVILAASVLMVAFDILLEQVATHTGMWQWENGKIPVRNYVAWFGVSLIMHTILKLAGIKTRNAIAQLVIICQVAFFSGLFIFYYFIR